MSKKLFIFCAAICFSSMVNAQFQERGLGAGVAFEFGLNPKVDYMSWQTENSTTSIFPKNRISIGPTIQFKNYQKFQVESSLRFTKSTYLHPQTSILGTQDFNVLDFSFPLGVNINTNIPFLAHSSIVYQIGAEINYRVIPQQANMSGDFSYTTPSVFAGIRLASEIKWYGRFEYGVNYTRNLNADHTFSLANTDAPSTNVNISQKMGQINLTLTYFFTPRVFNWSKNRYNLDGILD